MPNTIPTIDTSNIPWSALVGTVLGYSVAQLDQIAPEQSGSLDHRNAVMQVIADAQASWFNVLAG